MSKSSRINVQTKERESSGSLLRRFAQYVQKSNVLKEVRKHQFYTKPQNRNLRRRSALLREERRKEYTRLYKMGMLKTKNKKGSHRKSS